MRPHFKIDRARWWTCSVPNDRNDELCVIGHVAEQLDVPTTQNGTGQNRRVSMKLGEMLGDSADADRLIYHAQGINDNKQIPIEDKEERLIDLFDCYGIRLSFYGSTGDW
jgi:hypothetical protein